jgi:UDP-N-acetylglucosamine:LPS N-acetylglucosamine transferase
VSLIFQKSVTIMENDKQRKIKILAVASGGGHWVQLKRLYPAFEGLDVTFVSVNAQYSADVKPYRFYTVRNATRYQKVALIVLFLQLLAILIRERPTVVVSTGSAPGIVALRIGKWLGARTVWIDSIANIDQISLSGRLAGPYADLWLTQWPHLALPGGPYYVGQIL